MILKSIALLVSFLTFNGEAIHDFGEKFSQHQAPCDTLITVFIGDDETEEQSTLSFYRKSMTSETLSCMAPTNASSFFSEQIIPGHSYMKNHLIKKQRVSFSKKHYVTHYKQYDKGRYVFMTFINANFLWHYINGNQLMTFVDDIIQEGEEKSIHLLIEPSEIGFWNALLKIVSPNPQRNNTPLRAKF